MEENRKPRPAFILLNRGEKIAGWIYLPFYLILISLMVAFVFLFLGRDLTAPKNLLYVNLIYGVINIVVLTICFRKYLGKSFRQARHFPGRFFAAVGIGFAIYWIGNYVVTFLIQIIQPGLENINDNALGEIAGHGMLLMVLYTVLLVPTVEELMFRGLIFSSIRPRSRFWAYAVSMLVFAVMRPAPPSLQLNKCMPRMGTARRCASIGPRKTPCPRPMWRPTAASRTRRTPRSCEGF